MTSHKIPQIKYEIVDLKKFPRGKCTTISQLLFGEHLKILEEQASWIKIKNLSDNYVGWLEKKNIFFGDNPSHKIISLCSNINYAPSLKSPSFKTLYFGSKIKVNNVFDQWSEIIVFHENRFVKGYISNHHLRKLDKMNMDWIKIAEKFIGSPYKWGGRSIFGIDCSGLLQLSLSVAIGNMPRDSGDQYNFFLNRLEDKSKLKFRVKKINSKNITKGDIVFWEGHVGIILSSKRILHANATKMSVTVDDFKIINEKLNNEIGSITGIFRLSNYSNLYKICN